MRAASRATQRSATRGKTPHETTASQEKKTSTSNNNNNRHIHPENEHNKGALQKKTHNNKHQQRD
jgi:hypothetical protein